MHRAGRFCKPSLQAFTIDETIYRRLDWRFEFPKATHASWDDEVTVMLTFAVFLFLGVAGGFLSGLLGVGGALIMIPLMLEAPPWFGLPPLSMQEVAGLSMVQVVFASISGVLRHHRNRCFHGPLFILLAVCMSGAALVGAVVSKWMPDTALLLTFGIMLIAAGTMLFIPVRGESKDEPASCDNVEFNHLTAIVIGLAVGLVGGLVGAGGGFLLIPLMLYILRIPLRVTVGTSLGVVLAGGIAGGIGKIVTGQVLWLPASGLILGSIVMAQAGAIVSHRTPARVLRYLLISVVIISGIRIWRDIILRLY